MNKNTNINYTEEYDDIEVFIDIYLQMLNSFVEDEYKLTYKERQFLVQCVIYQYNGGQLSDFYDFQDYMMGKKFCSKPNHVSMYKHKLSVKKWVKTSKYKFLLGKNLNLEKGKDITSQLTISFKYAK